MEYLPREWAPPSRSRAAEGWAEARSACRIQAVARGFLLRRSLAWCPICLCRTDEPVTFASCEHVLCRSCSHACARRAMRSCPLCRAPCKWDLPPAQRLWAPPSEASGDSSEDEAEAGAGQRKVRRTQVNMLAEVGLVTAITILLSTEPPVAALG